MAELISKEVAHLWAALEDVQDPEFPMSIVDMGLVIEVQKWGRTAQVKMTFTAMGCPCMDMIMEDTRARLRQEGWSCWRRRRRHRGRANRSVCGVSRHGGAARLARPP